MSEWPDRVRAEPRPSGEQSVGVRYRLGHVPASRTSGLRAPLPPQISQQSLRQLDSARRGRNQTLRTQTWQTVDERDDLPAGQSAGQISRQKRAAEKVYFHPGAGLSLQRRVAKRFPHQVRPSAQGGGNCPKSGRRGTRQGRRPRQTH